ARPRCPRRACATGATEPRTQGSGPRCSTFPLEELILTRTGSAGSVARALSPSRCPGRELPVASTPLSPYPAMSLPRHDGAARVAHPVRPRAGVQGELDACLVRREHELGRGDARAAVRRGTGPFDPEDLAQPLGREETSVGT